MATFREKLMKVATDNPAIRKYIVPILKSASRGKLEITDRDYDHFYIKYPDTDGQTYDSYIIHHRNPKTVYRLAQAAMQLWQKSNPNSDDANDLMDFINKYVKEKTNGKWDYVAWNSKSYPD